jgi:hypothetical protein
LDAADVRGLLGLLLADGSLVSYRTPGGGYIQLTLTAGLSESAFLEEKVEEFKHFIPTKAEILPYRTQTRANGRNTPFLRFRVSTNKLRPVYNLLYPRGERLITQTALDLLGASAAAWTWAEGGRLEADGSSSLVRVGQTPDEAGLVSRWIHMLTGASSQLSDERIKPRLIFSPEQTEKLQQALIPYAPRTRTHLFTGDVPDVSTIRSARTELLLGQGESQPEGNETASVA